MKPQTNAWGESTVKGVGNNLCHAPGRSPVSMSFASEIFRDRTILERGIGGFLIYRSFYGLINGIHLGEGRGAGALPSAGAALSQFYVRIK